MGQLEDEYQKLKLINTKSLLSKEEDERKFIEDYQKLEECYKDFARKNDELEELVSRLESQLASAKKSHESEVK